MQNFSYMHYSIVLAPTWSSIVKGANVSTIVNSKEWLCERTMSLSIIDRNRAQSFCFRVARVHKLVVHNFIEIFDS